MRRSAQRSRRHSRRRDKGAGAGDKGWWTRDSSLIDDHVCPAVRLSWTSGITVLLNANPGVTLARSRIPGPESESEPDVPWNVSLVPGPLSRVPNSESRRTVVEAHP